LQDFYIFESFKRIKSTSTIVSCPVHDEYNENTGQLSLVLRRNVATGLRQKNSNCLFSRIRN